MSADEHDAPGGRPVADEPSLARRRARLAVVAGVSCAVTAAGLSGVGLLLPGGSAATSIRVAGAFAAVLAGGVLVRLDGVARTATTTLAVAASSALVALLTFPASPVSLADGSGLLVPESDEGAPPPDGPTEGTLPPGGSGGAGSGVLRLPSGADVTVEGGAVVVRLPDGRGLVLGDAAIDVGGEVADGSVSVEVVDGTLRRSDGGPIGPGVGLGGATLERSDGTQVAIESGELLDVPAPIETDETDERDAVLAILLAGFALVAFAPPVVRIGDRVGVRLIDPDDAADDEPARTGGSASEVEAGLADVLRSMLADPDPRTSVIGAYARLLAALDEAGSGRREEEGPHEHLWRVLGPLGVRRQPVHQLAELFVRARFTPHPVTDTHRQAAITALADAVGDLRLQAADVAEAAMLVGVVPAPESDR